MEKEKLKANENFFDNVHSMLNEGGVYIWIDEKEPFKREGDYLICSKKGYEKVKAIVSPSYVDYRFKEFNQ